MQAFQQFTAASFLDTLVSLLAAFVLGGLIGLERQYRQRTAGLRTNVLVALGAAAFVDMAHTLAGNDGAVRVIAYVVSGVGFLGAGVIMREEGNVRGINTAATLWASAAVGAAAGADQLATALLLTGFVLAANTLLRPMVNAINRKPMESDEVEVTYRVTVIAEKDAQGTVLDQLEEALAHANYPVNDLDIRAFGDNEVAIEATLASTSVDTDELEQLVQRLAPLPGVVHAYRNSSTTE